MLFSKIILFIFLMFAIKSTNGSDTYCDGTGWEQFRDEKCYKLIQDWASRDQAKTMCEQEWLPQSDASTPQLVSIKSVEEQDFLTDYAFNKSGVEINVWIGAKRLPNSNYFVWDDDSELEFTNWAQDSPSDEVKKGCAVMQSQLMKSIDGKWKDVPCQSPNYVLCEKLQRWSFSKLQQSFLATRKKLEDTDEQLRSTQNELSNTKQGLTSTQQQLSKTQAELTDTQTELGSTKNSLTNTQKQLSSTQIQVTNTQNQLSITTSQLTNTQSQLVSTQTDLTGTKSRLNEAEVKIQNTIKNPVPVGFIYVQLSNQAEPSTLWSAVQWKDVTAEYAGLFFRAEGGDSETFGTVQQGNAPRVTDVKLEHYSYPGGGQLWYQTSLNIGDQSSGRGIFSGSFNDKDGYTHRFYQSGGEVRPRNTAMRVWKRI